MNGDFEIYGKSLPFLFSQSISHSLTVLSFAKITPFSLILDFWESAIDNASIVLYRLLSEFMFLSLWRYVCAVRIYLVESIVVVVE